MLIVQIALGIVLAVILLRILPFLLLALVVLGVCIWGFYNIHTPDVLLLLFFGGMATVIYALMLNGKKKRAECAESGRPVPWWAKENKPWMS